MFIGASVVGEVAMVTRCPMDSSRLAALAIEICWVLYYGYFGPVPPGHGEAGVEGVRAMGHSCSTIITAIVTAANAWIRTPPPQPPIADSV